MILTVQYSRTASQTQGHHKLSDLQGNQSYSPRQSRRHRHPRPTIRKIGKLVSQTRLRAIGLGTNASRLRGNRQPCGLVPIAELALDRLPRFAHCCYDRNGDSLALSILTRMYSCLYLETSTPARPVYIPLSIAGCLVDPLPQSNVHACDCDLESNSQSKFISIFHALPSSLSPYSVALCLHALYIIHKFACQRDSIAFP